MSDPNVDAWDRYVDDQDKAEEERIAFYKRHRRDIASIAGVLGIGRILTGDDGKTDPAAIAKLVEQAEMIVLTVEYRGRHPDEC
ncbi:MAG: hypothetical protein MJA29_08710 [Candidatus Omnitrophica bacterium]|nr:hypothetical protein [Candidatus Omnitrophota bacterium]